MSASPEYTGPSLWIHGLGPGERPYMQIVVPLDGTRTDLSNRILAALFDSDAELAREIESCRAAEEGK